MCNQSISRAIKEFLDYNFDIKPPEHTFYFHLESTISLQNKILNAFFYIKFEISNVSVFLLQDNWPHNALELAEVMFKTFSDVAKSNYGQGHATPAQFAMQVCIADSP